MQSADAAKTRVRIIESELEKKKIYNSFLHTKTNKKQNKQTKKNKTNCCEVETL